MTTRTLLTADAHYYVATTGSDSTGDGSADYPWRTPAHAAIWIQGNIDMGAFIATVHVANGTYGPTYIHNPFVGGDPLRKCPVVFEGNTSDPSQVVISSSTFQCFNASANATFQIKGFKLCGTAGGVYASDGASIWITGRMEYGSVGSGKDHIQANAGGAVILDGSDYTISGGASHHMLASGGGVIEVAGAVGVTLTGTPAFGSAFAYSYENGTILAGGMTFTGAATGSRFNTNTGGGIGRTGGNTTYFPGDAAGTNNGWYA